MPKSNEPRFILKWQLVAFIVLFLSIILHFLIQLGSFKEVYHLTLADLPLVFSIIVCGIPLVVEIGLKLFKGDLGADSLAAIAVITATYLGEYLAASLVLLMLATGQILEAYAVRKASSVLLALAERMPSVAHRKVGKEIENISIYDIQIGNIIVVYPHETCPMDGIVSEGYGSMDESYLTGEPYYVSKAPGVTVLSGSINGESLLVIQATQRPQDSRYAKIMKVMEGSEQKRPRIRRLSDQLGAIFAPFSLIYASLAWYLTDDPVRFLAVLVIATPCPLLIAIPITIISAISLAAKRGIIIRNPVILEQLPLCKTAIFDKTGTLTYGKAELEEIIPFPGFDKLKILQQAASLERFSKHPLGEAILKASKKSGLVFLDVDYLSENPGEGLVGSINGTLVQVTNRKLLEQKDPTAVLNLPPQSPGMESIILINHQVAAILRFRDKVRQEGYSFIRHLEPIHKFEKIIVLSGDRLSEVKYLAQQLGIKEIYAGQTPEQKVQIVQEETSKARTLFMGDGINDAPALAVATVGLAFGAQNIIATEAAGAVFLETSLAKVDELIHISLFMRQVALVSAAGGMLLSIIGMYFAGIGMIKPVLGALLQEGIDIIAILYALQLTWKSTLFEDIKE